MSTVYSIRRTLERNLRLVERDTRSTANKQTLNIDNHSILSNTLVMRKFCSVLRSIQISLNSPQEILWSQLQCIHFFFVVLVVTESYVIVTHRIPLSEVPVSRNHLWRQTIYMKSADRRVDRYFENHRVIMPKFPHPKIDNKEHQAYCFEMCVALTHTVFDTGYNF